MRKDRPRTSLWLLAVAIAGCGSGAGSHDYSQTISQDIQTNGKQQIQHVTNRIGGSGSAIINNAHCGKTPGTQAYMCTVHYTYQNSEGTYKYEVNVSGNCDSGGKCRWHVEGSGTLVGAEPD